MKSNYTDNSPEQSSMASEPAAMTYAVTPQQVGGVSYEKVWKMAQKLSQEEKERMARQLLGEPACRKKVDVRLKGRSLTDEELEKELEGLPSWDEVEHPDLSDVDYSQVRKALGGRVIKSIEKWL